MKKAKTFEQFLEQELINAIKDASNRNKPAAINPNNEESYEVELELDGLIVRTDAKHLVEVMAALATIVKEVTE